MPSQKCFCYVTITLMVHICSTVLQRAKEEFGRNLRILAQCKLTSKNWYVLCNYSRIGPGRGKQGGSEEIFFRNHYFLGTKIKKSETDLYLMLIFELLGITGICIIYLYEKKQQKVFI